MDLDFIKHRVTAGIRDEGGLLPAIKKAVALLAGKGMHGLLYGEHYQPQTSYEQWVAMHDTLDDEDREQIRNAIEHFDYQPMLSIVVPTYNGNLAYLKEAVQSVQVQLYPSVELCIADDASTDQKVLSYLHELQSSGAAKVFFRKENGHISENTNSALSLATGDWVLFLDHDDKLTEDACFQFAKTINENPSLRMIYSDEDKLDRKGNRARAYFKPGFNLELLRGNNYICHLVGYRRDFVQQLGGLRVGYEGAQDHDLALRAAEILPPSEIAHIPLILYHWREHEESTASGMGAKSYAINAGLTAVREHLARCNIPAEVRSSSRGYYSVKYKLPAAQPSVAIVIPTRDQLHLLRQCIESIRLLTTYKNYDIVVVDNCSEDKATLEYLDNLHNTGSITIIKDSGTFNFSRINNDAIRELHHDFVLLLNNDTEVLAPDWLEELVATASVPGVGVVGARLLYPDDCVQHSGIVLGIGGSAGHAFKGAVDGDPGYWFRAAIKSEFSALTGACLLVERELFWAVGGMDEHQFPIAFNDVDFCLKVQQMGRRNVLCPEAVLRHHESKSRGYEDSPEKQYRFGRERARLRQKWFALIADDPSYNPNLRRDHEHFLHNRDLGLRKGKPLAISAGEDDFDVLGALASADLIQQFKVLERASSSDYVAVLLIGPKFLDLAMAIEQIRPSWLVGLVSFGDGPEIGKPSDLLVYESYNQVQAQPEWALVVADHTIQSNTELAGFISYKRAQGAIVNVQPAN